MRNNAQVVVCTFSCTTIQQFALAKQTVFRINGSSRNSCLPTTHTLPLASDYAFKPIASATLVLAVTMLLSGCVGVRTKTDGICRPMRDFANAAKVGEAHSVELRTAWGSGLGGDAEFLAEKACSHTEYPPGIRLCKYLLPNTSTEFMESNIRRALGCLGAESLAPPNTATVSYLNGKVYSYSVPGVDEDVRVELEFSTGGKSGDPSLRITAERYED